MNPFTRVTNAIKAFASTPTQQANNDINGRRTTTDFWRSAKKMVSDWSQVEMTDQDMYTGYSYAAIRKRANRASALGKKFLQTEASDAIQKAAKDKGTDIEHPYLTLVRDSKEFSQRKFWHDISTYLDLEGVYYLMAVRAVGQNQDGTPKVGAIQKFVMMNPYNVKRVLKGSNNELGGYVEAVNGQYREIPKEMIIEIRLLNPFDNDLPYSMTDAAKESQFVLKQAGDYTRHSIQGNTNAPGAITTDVQLDDAIFDNFVSRIQNHTKGEPLYGNGAGAIKWESMQIDLDKAALDKINEIHRSILFAVSGTSKTTLGIEESGTTRDTSQVQKDNFTEDAVMPQIEDIIDALNLDYRRWYPEWEKDKYEIVLDNPLETNREAELKDIEIRDTELNLRDALVAKGYEYEIAAKYAHGEISLEDLGEPTLEEEITPEQATAMAQQEAGFNPDPNAASAEPQQQSPTGAITKAGKAVPPQTSTAAGNSVGDKAINKFVRKEDNEKILKEARARVKEQIKAQKDEAKAKKQAEKDKKTVEKEQKNVPVVDRPAADIPVVPAPAVEPQVNGLQVVKFNNQLASRDIPTLYDGLGIDFNALGCIMLKTTKIPVAQYVPNAGADIIDEGRHSGVVGETEPHVTLLFGLLQNGNVWKDKVDSVLETWNCSTVVINRVSFFDVGDSYAIVGIVDKSPELVDGHERLTLLPHINTFSEYIPHISLAYVKKDDEVRDKWVYNLNKRYQGQMVQTRGIDYGDLPEADGGSEGTDPKAKNHIEDEHRMDGPSVDPLMGLAEITDQEMLDAGFILDEDGDWVKGPNYEEYSPSDDDDWDYDDEDDEDYPVETPPEPKQPIVLAQNGRETYVEYAHTHDDIEDDSYTNSSLEKAQNALDDEFKDRVILGESDLLRATQRIEADMVNAYIIAVRNGDFSEARRIISESEERRFRNELQLALAGFFTLLTPIYAQQLFRERANEFEKQGVFSMSNEIENQIQTQANKGADSHIKTITNDLDEAVRRAVQNEIEGALIDLVAKEVQTQNPTVLKRLPVNPNAEDIAKEVKKGTFSQKDNPLYKRARQLAREGNGLDSITRALRKEYDNISVNRARTIARHETNRVFNMAQYQADKQFLTEAGLMENAYKIMKNRADDPCPICAKVIEDSRRNPIPFTQNFVNKGEGFKVNYTTKTGKQGTMKLNANYESISAGNIHVNCRCEYVLLIKQADGSFLNRVDNVVYNYSPSQARDGDGKWTDGGGSVSLAPLNSLNPTGGLYVDYTPEARAKAPLGPNMTTLAATTNRDPDTKITVYRGAPSNQKKIAPGDFITDMKELAESYTGDGNVISKEVRLGDILDDSTEPEGNEYIYRPGADKEVAKRDASNDLDDKTDNGGPGSGNFGHGGRPGQIGGSAGKGGSGGSSKSAKKSVLKGMVANARKNGGMTTNVLGDSPTEGIAFAPRKDTEQIISDKNFNEKSLDSFVDKHWDTLQKEGMHIGGWHNTDDGNWYLDISKVGPYNKKTIKEAQDAEQLAVFDLKNFNEIKTGDIKDGKYIKSAEPETIFAEAFGGGKQGGVQNSSEKTSTQAEEDERVLNAKGNPNHEKATGRFTFGTAAQKSKLAELEAPIRANSKETFHAVDTKGEVITTLSGNSKQVKVPFAEAMKIAASKNAILTHNHPSQGTGQNSGKTFPFSLDDLKTASMTNVRGIRAVGETHDYAISRKGDTWPTPSNVTRAYNAGKKVAETKLKTMVSEGKMTNAEAQFEWYHEAIKSVADKYDLSYERREVK